MPPAMINSGSNLPSGTRYPAGILAGYLGGATVPAQNTLPLVNVNGTVFVNNSADINAAGGDGIRAYNYGIGDVNVNDNAGTITALSTATPPNGSGNGISANNFGTGNIHVTTADGTVIHSGGPGISAINLAPSTPSTTVVSVVAHGTINSGNILTGGNNLAAGILAGYNPNSGAVAPNDHGSVTVDDFASITATGGADGIRAFNFGTGTVTITVESGAIINGSHIGVSGSGSDNGNVTITNHGSITGTTDAIFGSTTGSGIVSIDNFGTLTGNIFASNNSTITNEAGADWSLNGNNPLGTLSTLSNAGTIDSNGATSSINGLSTITNTGTIEVHTGSLKLAAAVSGTGALTIDAGATLELTTSVSSGQTVTFASNTGMLKLDNAQSFHGTVAGFSTTDGTQANSDQIDLANINHKSASFSESFDSNSDTLTVTDGTNTAVIKFTGNVGTLNFVDDGHLINGVAGTSGTMVYDPPASTPSPGAVMASLPGVSCRPGVGFPFGRRQQDRRRSSERVAERGRRQQQLRHQIRQYRQGSRERLPCGDRCTAVQQVDLRGRAGIPERHA